MATVSVAVQGKRPRTQAARVSAAAIEEDEEEEEEGEGEDPDEYVDEGASKGSKGGGKKRTALRSTKKVKKKMKIKREIPPVTNSLSALMAARKKIRLGMVQSAPKTAQVVESEDCDVVFVQRIGAATTELSAATAATTGGVSNKGVSYVVLIPGVSGILHGPQKLHVTLILQTFFSASYSNTSTGDHAPTVQSLHLKKTLPLGFASAIDRSALQDFIVDPKFDALSFRALLTAMASSVGRLHTYMEISQKEEVVDTLTRVFKSLPHLQSGPAESLLSEWFEGELDETKVSHIMQELSQAGYELFSVASSLRTGLIGGLRELQLWEADGPSTVVNDAKKASRESFGGSLHNPDSLKFDFSMLEEAFSVLVEEEIKGKAPLQKQMVSLRERNALATGMSAEEKKIYWIALHDHAKVELLKLLRVVMQKRLQSDKDNHGDEVEEAEVQPPNSVAVTQAIAAASVAQSAAIADTVKTTEANGVLVTASSATLQAAEETSNAKLLLDTLIAAEALLATAVTGAVTETESATAATAGKGSRSPEQVNADRDAKLDAVKALEAKQKVEGEKREAERLAQGHLLELQETAKKSKAASELAAKEVRDNADRLLAVQAAATQVVEQKAAAEREEARIRKAENVELSPECHTLTVAQQTELTNLLWQVGGSSEFDKVEGQHGGLLGVVCTFRQKTVCLVFANLLLRTGFVVTIGPTNADETVVSGGAVKCVQRAIAQKRGEEIEQDLHYYARQSGLAAQLQFADIVKAPKSTWLFDPACNVDVSFLDLQNIVWASPISLPLTISSAHAPAEIQSGLGACLHVVGILALVLGAVSQDLIAWDHDREEAFGTLAALLQGTPSTLSGAFLKGDESKRGQDNMDAIGFNTGLGLLQNIRSVVLNTGTDAQVSVPSLMSQLLAGAVGFPTFPAFFHNLHATANPLAPEATVKELAHAANLEFRFRTFGSPVEVMDPRPNEAIEGGLGTGMDKLLHRIQVGVRKHSVHALLQTRIGAEVGTYVVRFLAGLVDAIKAVAVNAGQVEVEGWSSLLKLVPFKELPDSARNGGVMHWLLQQALHVVDCVLFPAPSSVAAARQLAEISLQDQETLAVKCLDILDTLNTAAEVLTSFASSTSAGGEDFVSGNSAFRSGTMSVISTQCWESVRERARHGLGHTGMLSTEVNNIAGAKQWLKNLGGRKYVIQQLMYFGFLSLVMPQLTLTDTVLDVRDRRSPYGLRYVTLTDFCKASEELCHTRLGLGRPGKNVISTPVLESLSKQQVPSFASFWPTNVDNFAFLHAYSVVAVHTISDIQSDPGGGADSVTGTIRSEPDASPHSASPRSSYHLMGLADVNKECTSILQAALSPGAKGIAFIARGMYCLEESVIRGRELAIILLQGADDRMTSFSEVLRGKNLTTDPLRLSQLPPWVVQKSLQTRMVQLDVACALELCDLQFPLGPLTVARRKMVAKKSGVTARASHGATLVL